MSICKSEIGRSLCLTVSILLLATGYASLSTARNITEGIELPPTLKNELQNGEREIVKSARKQEASEEEEEEKEPGFFREVGGGIKSFFKTAYNKTMSSVFDKSYGKIDSEGDVRTGLVDNVVETTWFQPAFNGFVSWLAGTDTTKLKANANSKGKKTTIGTTKKTTEPDDVDGDEEEEV